MKILKIPDKNEALNGILRAILYNRILHFWQHISTFCCVWDRSKIIFAFFQNISDQQDIFIQCIKGFTVGIEEEFFTRASHTTVTCVPPFVAILANNLHTHLNKSLMFSSYVPAYDHVR